MTAEAAEKPKAHWGLRIVGVLGVLWNGYGAYDYTMSYTKGDPHLAAAGMSPAQIAYFHGLPAWVTGVWAIGVWGGVIGGVLLLARSKYALHAFVASLAGLLASLVHTYLLDSAGSKAAGMQMPGFSAMLVAGCLFFVWYAARVTKQGLLR
jgi:hypothetical protein